MKYIYLITAIDSRDLSKRTFGFYFDLELAKHAVFKDLGSMNECLYSHAVIERVRDGIHPICEQVQWYYWHTGAKKWKKMSEQPSGFLGIVNWGIG